MAVLVKPYEGKEPYIFISYSHRDSKRVFPILKQLSDAGFRLWYDEGIDPGTEWPESIATHLANSTACIAFAGPLATLLGAKETAYVQLCEYIKCYILHNDPILPGTE